MLTIFAQPKAFKGHFGVIQRNAISQWARLSPKPEIILLGGEEGTAEIAEEFGVRYVREVHCNEFGTPMLDHLFEQARSHASNDILCYVNADILLLGDFMGAVKRVSAWRNRFLMVGRRTNLDLDVPAIYELPYNEPRLRALVQNKGRLAAANAIDYFVFPRGLFASFPPFAIGRPWWDNWFLWQARASKAALVDASEVILAVHQNHDYSHLPKGQPNVMECEEATRNKNIAGNSFRTIEDATYKLSANRITYNFRHFRISTERAVLPRWTAFLKTSGPVRHRLGLRRSSIAGMLGRIRALATR